MNKLGQSSLRAYFVLVFALSIPFWVIGALSSLKLLPALPVSALGVVCPVLAAVILIYRQNGPAGVSVFLKRSFDFGRMGAKTWLVPLLLLEPFIKSLSYAAIRLGGVQIPVPQFTLLPALALLVVFFIAGLGEELGWSGYALDPLQDRFGALRASILIGVIWAVWHFIPLFEAHRSLVFILWWSLGTVASRVIIVWLYNNTGKSVFAAAFYHAMMNLAWQLFPVNGSFFDPRVDGLITAVLAIIVVIVWGSQTLTRPKTAWLSQPG